jgi:hypothetical protein
MLRTQQGPRTDRLAIASIALWWPVSSASVQVRGYWYLAALLALATLPPARTQP